MFDKLKLKRKIARLKKQIEDNNDDARYELAMIYLDGTVLKKDEKQAKKLLETASINGHIKSKAFLTSKKALSAFNIGVDAVNKIVDSLR